MVLNDPLNNKIFILLNHAVANPPGAPESSPVLEGLALRNLMLLCIAISHKLAIVLSTL